MSDAFLYTDYKTFESEPKEKTWDIDVTVDNLGDFPTDTYQLPWQPSNITISGVSIFYTSWVTQTTVALYTLHDTCTWTEYQSSQALPYTSQCDVTGGMLYAYAGSTPMWSSSFEIGVYVIDAMAYLRLYANGYQSGSEFDITFGIRMSINFSYE